MEKVNVEKKKSVKRNSAKDRKMIQEHMKVNMNVPLSNKNSLVLCSFNPGTGGYRHIPNTPLNITQVVQMEKWIKENGDKLITVQGKIFMFRYLGSRKLLSKVVYSLQD